MRRLRIGTAALAALSCAMCLVASARTAEAGDAAKAKACFAPEMLKAIDKVRRGDRSFDARGPEQADAPAAAISAELRGVIRRVDVPDGQKLIALTFDLCEAQGEVAGYDGAIFDYLNREGVRATIFAGGKWLRSHAARAEQLILNPLFEIANHSETHRNFRTISAPERERELLGPQRVYEAARARLAAKQCFAQSPGAFDAVPQRMRLFRFPFGACNAAAVAAVNDAGLLAIQWDVSTGDPSPDASARAIARTMVARAKPGSIVIAHANGRGWHTAAALPLAIPKLKAMGFEFVTVSELLARGKPVIAGSCFDARPGDTNRYDGLLARRKTKPAQAAKALMKTRRPSPEASAPTKVRVVRSSAGRKPSAKKS